MPRLLSINTYHYRRGGSDVIYLDHAGLMEQAGWSNAFFAMHHPNNLETPWSRHFIDELELGHAYSPWQKLTMASKVIWSFEAQRKLRGLLEEFRPDIAHLHCIYHHHSPSILSTLSEAGVPAVMTAHDLKIACPAYKMFNSTGVCERCREGSVLNVVRHRCIRGSLAASAIVAAESGLHRWLDTYRKHLAKVVVPSRFFMQKFIEWGWPADRFVLCAELRGRVALRARLRTRGLLSLFRPAGHGQRRRDADPRCRAGGCEPADRRHRPRGGSLEGPARRVARRCRVPGLPQRRGLA